MTATIAYTRVSTADQDTAAQFQTIEQTYRVDHHYTDEATSGTIKALKRPGFAALFKYVREGDTVIVPAIDRLGRSTVDVLETVEALQAEGVRLVSMREGFDLGTPAGKLMLTMLAGVGELERENLRQRQREGIETGKAQGKHMGRPRAADPAEVARWRRDNDASISETARAFGVSKASVTRACAGGGA